jgi:trans-aconitate methyltransferase
VVRHDVTTDAIPSARYDLIHARLVLSHLPQRGDVMQRLVQALRPGGWLVIEDFWGCPTSAERPGWFSAAAARPARG